MFNSDQMTGTLAPGPVLGTGNVDLCKASACLLEELSLEIEADTKRLSCGPQPQWVRGHCHLSIHLEMGKGLFWFPQEPGHASDVWCLVAGMSDVPEYVRRSHTMKNCCTQNTHSPHGNEQGLDDELFS